MTMTQASPNPTQPWRSPPFKSAADYRSAMLTALQTAKERIAAQGHMQVGYLHLESDALYIEAVILKNNTLHHYRYSHNPQGVHEQSDEFTQLTPLRPYFLMPRLSSAHPEYMNVKEYHHQLSLDPVTGDLNAKVRPNSPYMRTVKGGEAVDWDAPLPHAPPEQPTTPVPYFTMFMLPLLVFAVIYLLSTQL